MCSQIYYKFLNSTAFLEFRHRPCDNRLPLTGSSNQRSAATSGCLLSSVRHTCTVLTASGCSTSTMWPAVMQKLCM